MKEQKKTKNIFLFLIWFLEGIVVGFGAILPGISGGTLCVAFGMYRPIIELISNIKEGLKKNGLMLIIFILGVAVGFVGLSGVAAILLEKNTVVVTCVFIGFILGTVPELWRDAGSQGRKKSSIFAMIIGFIVMVILLTLFKTKISVSIAPGLFGYLLCGLLWGLSFIVPGLSSSSLLLFFGLYQPMLKGISTFDFAVLIPMGIGMLLCVVLLSKAVGYAYKKQYSIVSHCVLGIVAATAVMILPAWEGIGTAALNLLYIICGGAVSYGFTCMCDRIRKKTEG